MCVPLTDLPVYFSGEIDDATMVALHGVTAAVDASVHDLARMSLVSMRGDLLRQGTRSAIIQDFNEHHLVERGVERLSLGRGKKLWRVADCPVPFKIQANSRPDRLDVAANGGQHLVGAFLFAYSYEISRGDARAGVPPRAGLSGLWLARIVDVVRPKQRKGKFGGNMAKLVLEDETPLGIPRGSEVRVLAV